jgi:hypothetical protein
MPGLVTPAAFLQLDPRIPADRRALARMRNPAAWDVGSRGAQQMLAYSQESPTEALLMVVRDWLARGLIVGSVQAYLSHTMRVLEDAGVHVDGAAIRQYVEMAVKVWGPRVPVQASAWTREDVRNFCEKCPGELATMVTLAWLTACRGDDLRGLRKGCVWMEEGHLMVEFPRRKNTTKPTRVKALVEPEDIPYLAPILAAEAPQPGVYAAERAPLFVTPMAEYQRALKEATGKTSHGLRRGAIQAAEAAGADLTALVGLSGHRSIGGLAPYRGPARTSSRTKKSR